MKLEFGRVEIQNFASYEDEVFDFSSMTGMNLICGKNMDLNGCANGSGKSFLMQTILFALFGQTLHNIKNENIPNRYVDKDQPTSVKLWFKADGTQYIVESMLSKKYHNMACNIYQIDDKGEAIDLSKSSVRETRKFIEKEILQCDMSIFLRTIMLTSDQTYNFFKLRPQQKKEFIEHIFDLSIFGDMYRLIHKDGLDLDKEIFALNRELLAYNNNHKEYQTQYDDYTASKKKELCDLTKTIKGLLTELKALEDTSPTSTKNLSNLDECRSKCSEIINHHMANRKIVTKKLQLLDREVRKLNVISAEKKKLLSNHVEVLDKLCDKCGPIFDKQYSITDTKALVESIAIKCDEIKNAEDKLTARQAEIENNIAEYKEALSKIDIKRKAIKDEANDVKLNKERKIYKIKMLKDQLDVKKVEDNPYATLLETASSTLETAQNNLSEMLHKMKYIKYAELIVSQDTIRKFIIKDLISLLNSQIQIYLNKIGAKFTCEFDDELNYRFITEAGEAEFDSFSSGEKMRLSIATSFAFRDFMATRSNIISNILILDEYIDSNLDESAINELVKILQEFIIRYNQSVYIVSHRKEINNDIFNNIVIIEKTNGISRVKYDVADEDHNEDVPLEAEE